MVRSCNRENKMNIGVISYILNPKSGARAPIEIAYALAKRNQVSFYAYRQNKDLQTIKTLKKRGIKVILFNKSKTPIVGGVLDFLTLFKLLKTYEHEILSTHTILPLLSAARASGAPVIATYYGTQFNILAERFLKKNFLLTLLDKILNLVILTKTFLMVWIANEIVGISKYTAIEAKRKYGRICKVIYLGNAPKHFAETPGPSKKRKASILTVSRITPYKQFEKIVDVVNILSERYKLSLTIVGSAPQAEYLKYLNKIKGKNTKILTNISDKKLMGLYKASDIYVTADKYLFFGMPILEAASFGKPAITLDYCAASELIKHGETGYVARSSKEFERYLGRLVGDRKLRTKIGKAAKIRAGKFGWEKTAREYEKLFRKVLKR